jgi:hypothetical protein
MKHSKTLEFLRIPLYRLYYLADVKEADVLDSKLLLQICQDYEADEVREIISSLEWAVKHPGFDFNALLPGLKHSNSDIYFYLTKVLEKMKKGIRLKPIKSEVQTSC